MEAKETKLKNLIERPIQYVIPLFQRSYSWRENNWEQLWMDIMDLYENEMRRTHFMGAIVSMQTHSEPQDVPQFLLIDGQQRLTTIFIILAAIREKALLCSNKKFANKVQNTLLVNYYYDKGDERYKLLLTQDENGTNNDRNSFICLIEREHIPDSLIKDAFTFFIKRLNQDDYDLDKLERIIIQNLSMVSIVLGEDDNPYVVFESLNAAGRPLTQADLIKNYFFMRISQDKQEEMYKKYWLPMQNGFDGKDLSEFIRHFLMKNGGIVKVGDVFYALKEQVSEDNAIEYLQEINIYSNYYKCLKYPERFESNDKLKKRFIRLNRIEVTTAYPILLYFYGEYANAKITLSDFLGVLDTLENYLIRRFVCDYKTNILNRLFASAYSFISSYNLGNNVDAFKAYLSTRDYPKDNEFSKKFKESKLFGGGDRKEKVKFILEAIENSYEHKETVETENLTIEHIIPQTLSNWWQDYLGENWQNIYEEYLDTIGNLTLTDYRKELSNSDFLTKRQIFVNSHLELNRYFINVKQWNAEQIRHRANVLLQRALEIWPNFSESCFSNKSAFEVTWTKPTGLEVLGMAYHVKSWRDVLEKFFNTIGEIRPDKFKLVMRIRSWLPDSKD